MSGQSQPEMEKGGRCPYGPMGNTSNMPENGSYSMIGGRKDKVIRYRLSETYCKTIKHGVITQDTLT
jgi:hypothetical protein